VHLKCCECAKEIQPGREYIRYVATPATEETGEIAIVPSCRECHSRLTEAMKSEDPEFTPLHSLDEKQIGRYVLNMLAISWQMRHEQIAFTLQDYGGFGEDAPAELRFVRDLFADGNPKSLVNKWTNGNPFPWLDRAAIKLGGEDE